MVGWLLGEGGREKGPPSNNPTTPPPTQNTIHSNTQTTIQQSNHPTQHHYLSIYLSHQNKQDFVEERREYVRHPSDVLLKRDDRLLPDDPG